MHIRGSVHRQATLCCDTEDTHIQDVVLALKEIFAEWKGRWVSLQLWRHRWGKKVAMGYAWGSPDGPLPWVSKQEFYLDSPAQVQLFPIHSPNCFQRGVLKTPIFSHFLAYNISTTPSGFQAIVPSPQPKPPVSSRRPSPSSPAPRSQHCHFTSAKLPVVLGSDWVCLFPTLNTPTPQPHNPKTQLWYCPSSLRLRGHRTLPSPPRALWSMGAQPTTQHQTAPPVHSRLLLWATKSAEWADVRGSLLAMEITGDSLLEMEIYPFQP